MTNSLYTEKPYWYPTADEELLIKAASAADKEEALSSWNEWLSKNDQTTVDKQLYFWGAIIYKNLKDVIKDQAVINKLKSVYRLNWSKNQRLFNAINPILKIISTENIPILLLKGASLSGYYGDSGSRFMNDVDILIPKENIERTFQILKTTGWEQVDLKYSFAKLIKSRHSMDFRNHQMGWSFDLHWGSLWCDYEKNIDKELWLKSQNFIFNGESVKILSASDLFFHIIIHALHYRWPQPRDIKWVIDLIKIYQQTPGLNWDRIIFLSRELSVTLQTKEIIKYLDDNFKLGIAKEVIEKFENLELTKMEKIQYSLMMNPKKPETAFKKFYIVSLGVYFKYLGEKYGFKNVNSWGNLRLAWEFFIFLIKYFKSKNFSVYYVYKIFLKIAKT